MTPDTEPALVDEFADYDGEPLYETVEFRWTNMANPPAIRAVAAIVGGVFLVAGDHSTRVVAVVVGLVLAVWAVTEAFSTRQDEGVALRLIRAAGAAAIGVALVVWPAITGRIISRLLAAGLALAGGQSVAKAFRGADRASGPRVGSVLRGLLTLAVAVALLVVPDTMLSIVLVLVGLFWMLSGFAAVIGNLSVAETAVEVSDVWPRFFEWLESRPHSADDRTQLYAKLFYEGRQAKRRLSRFFILMGFATTIAAFGIISDSTAVVIGAMLVAPLMTPLMGTSLSLVMGWPHRASRSALVALGGVGLAIGLSALYGAMSPLAVDAATNSQVISRVVPTMVDLVIAIAAGGAGAFALSRPDVSDALPGVAVAIALVPPLAVTGLMLQAGQGDDALGALLLFTTNMVAILVVGAGVFVLTGVVPVRQLVRQEEWIRNSATLLAILAVAIVAVLGATSEQIRAQAFDTSEVQAEVEDWIGDRSLTVFSVDVSASEVGVVVVGEDSPGDPEDLAAALESELGRDLLVTVRWVPDQRFVVDGTDE